MRPFAIALMALVGPALAAQDASDLATARTYVRWFYEGTADSLWPLFGGELRGVVPTPEALRQVRAQLLGQLGEERTILHERVQRDGDRVGYTRVVQFTGEQRFVVGLAFDADTIYGFVVRPFNQPAPTAHLDYETRTPLRLPFEGAWYVYWGGRTLEQNYHVAYPDQRFAYDLMVMRDGSSHTGDGTAAEQYYCWGRPIVAPGPGVVVAAANDVPDNPPGELNPAQALGNHVILDHGNGEFSFLAHFRQGTVTVSAGDTVAPGDQLGECGNSGNTTEPHLHYHLQTTPTFGQGQGLPAFFNDYLADGERIARGEPVKGQVVVPTTR